MVATVPNNGKRRGGGGFHGGAPNRQRFKPGKQMNARNMGAMFNVNQLGDNPGFLDFNEDVQIPPVPSTSAQAAPATATGEGSTEVAAAATTADGKGAKGGQNRKGGNPNQKRFRNGNNMRRMPPGMGHWGPPMPPMPMFPMGGGGRRNGGPFGPPPPHFRVPPMGMRGGPMMPPPGPNGRFRGGFGPGPMPMMPHRPMMPPPMRGGPMNFNFNNWNRPDGPPMRRNPNGKLPPGGRPGKGAKGGAPRNANGKGPKPSPNKKGAKAKEPVKPREEYPLDQPWVTDEIKEEHDKKVQLADRLKGHKDDALFAQFKEQRDKFVKMYDAAKLEFIGKHPEQDVDKIMTESGTAAAAAASANKAATSTTKPETQKSNDAVSTDTSAATTTATTAADAAK